MLKTPIDMVADIHQSSADALAAHVDTHIENTHDAAVAASADGPPSPGTPQFCAIYTAARPVLVFARGMLFFKPKWQTVITGLIGGLDTICPQQ